MTKRQVSTQVVECDLCGNSERFDTFAIDPVKGEKPSRTGEERMRIFNGTENVAIASWTIIRLGLTVGVETIDLCPECATNCAGGLMRMLSRLAESIDG